MPTTQLDSWKPRAYQLEALKLGLSQACLGLLMDPGLGKTSVVYMLIKILKMKGFIKRTLVICPLRPAYRVWPHQKDKYQDFSHFKVNILHGPGKEDALRDLSADIYVINPEGLPWLFGAGEDSKGKMTVDKERLTWIKKAFDVLVVDESTKFKNPQTSRFKLLRKIVGAFKRRYILTGTPTPKGLMDLFGQVYILDEGASLGSYISHYRTQYFIPSGFGGYDWTPQPDADRRIGEKIAPLTYRVKAKGNIDLPELMFDDIWVDLPPAARKKYADMEFQMMADLEAGKIVAANAAVASGKCRQIANGGMYVGDGTWEKVHTAKLEALKDLLEQLQGEPLLITYEFEFDAEMMGGIEVFGSSIPSISTGNVKKDDANVVLFSKGKLPAVMGQPQSVSLGIDGLQDSCFHIAMYGVTWRLQDYIQVIDRVRRSGNKSKHVVVHRILARDTVDERVLSVIDDRGATQASFMEVLQGLRKL